MAINASDIVILKSERLTDEPNGGGQMTATVVQTGDVNNMFDDISRPTLAGGGVSIRKMYGAVRSATVDKALGALMIVLKDAQSDNVSTLLFNTNDHYDTRAQARDKIEQFVVLGRRSSLKPVGTQRKDQTSIVLYTENGRDVPRVGETLVLKSTTQGNEFEQTVKITNVSSSSEEYTYVVSPSVLKFRATEVVVEISQPLAHTFAGSDPRPGITHATEVFKTESNAKAKYYGIKPLAAAAASGDSKVVADGIFTPIIPNATKESAALDQPVGLLTKTVIGSGAIKTKNLGSKSAGTYLFTLPSAWVPGSLRLNASGSIYKDSGSELELTTGVERLSDVVVNAARGEISITLQAGVTLSCEYQPGSSVELMPYTAAFNIDQTNRQLTYTTQLEPAPLRGSVRVEFQYLGQWYELRDDGDGKLLGSGSGSVNYNTGSTSFNLPGEPDAGSKVLLAWSRLSQFDVSNETATAKLTVPLPDVPHGNGLTLNWTSRGNNKTATIAATGAITGDATGVVEEDKISISTSHLPSSDIDVVYSVDQQAAGTVDVNVSPVAGQPVTISTGINNIRASSIRFSVNCTFDVKDIKDGVENITRHKQSFRVFGRLDKKLYSYVKGDYVHVGDVDTASGVITYKPHNLRRKVFDTVWQWKGGYEDTIWGPVGEPRRLVSHEVEVDRGYNLADSVVRVSYNNGTVQVPRTSTVPLNSIKVIVGVGTDLPILPGSMAFDLGGVEFIDRGDGVIYKSWNVETAAGIRAGQSDYRAAVIELSYFDIKDSISSLSVNFSSATGGDASGAAVHGVVFRTRNTPLRPSGMQFLARRASDTALMRAGSDNTGRIAGVFDAADKVGALRYGLGVNGYSTPIEPVTTSGGSAAGEVDYSTGVVAIRFTHPVILSTLTYNAVSYTSVPLDPDLLGLNPVKLPTNGKVPIFRAGDLAVVHNTKSIALASPSAGDVINCNRTNVDVIVIKDAKDKPLDPVQYTIDKVAGTATLASGFVAQDAAGNSLTLPLSLLHRVEDTVAIADVNIDGTIKFLTQLTNDYSQADSYISSAMYFGNMQARVKNIYDTQTDQPGFDKTNAAEAVATYDTLNYPILIDNKSCVEERWKIRFISATGFQLIGEKRGVIATGSINADFSPINPFTNQPYFTIRSAGWGTGWVSSNTFRFDTEACAAPAWAIRTVLPDSGSAVDDKCEFEFRVDAD